MWVQLLNVLALSVTVGKMERGVIFTLWKSKMVKLSLMGFLLTVGTLVNWLKETKEDHASLKGAR